MAAKEIAPSPSALLLSLRGLGYSPETALADLVDNCIAAQATVIDIALDWNNGEPRVSVLDDGRGMDGAGLLDAMCFGGTGPTESRELDDLGRFGLGLKTASLSQCRQLSVFARHNDAMSSASWDVDHVAKARKWEVTVPLLAPPHAALDALASRRHGTLICWDRIDPMGGLFGLDKSTFFLRVQDIANHLGMVFHRFINGDARRIAITVNGRQVKAWDPFQKQHPATIVMQTEPVRYSSLTIAVTPFVLPHRDRFENEAAYEAAGGPGGWSERQGFYVYRGKRLLVAGGWLGLGGTRAWTRDESSRLARISVDLPTNLDSEWRIDVRKSQARPPSALRPKLTAIAKLCREKAREIFAWRGSRSRGITRAAPIDPLWHSTTVSGISRYKINRQHPAITGISQVLGANAPLLDALFSMIEKTVPVERIWLDVSESQGSPPSAMGAEEISDLAAKVAALAMTLPQDISAEERVDQLIRHLPGNVSDLRRATLQLLIGPQ